MNTKASVAYGWGILVLAGGGAYYFAKRSINSERAERAGARNRSRTAQTSIRMSNDNTSRTRRRMQLSSDQSRADRIGSDPTQLATVALVEGDQKSLSRRAGRSHPPTTHHSQTKMGGQGQYEATRPSGSRRRDT
jgi:hypothetical protein